MIGERENNYTETNYGTLVMRPYEIDGNEINAFYDSDDNLVFVLDNTVNEKKPNVLLVINPDGDKKWDEILSNDYDMDLETIRPKQDNKYQKLDIEYSGLNVYENLINAYKAGDDLSEQLNQLIVLRDAAARHSAMTRLSVANEVISKTNATIVKTKETIVRLQNRIKSLKTKLAATKKEIGKVSTKQSAARVLKLESQIEATNEKLKRAKKRLESAQRRLEVATVDAELASNLLNQPSSEIKQQKTKSKPVIVAPKYEMQKIEPEIPELTDESDEDDLDDAGEYVDSSEDKVKPLFDKDPEIIDEDIAFKPISFNAPIEKPVPQQANVPVLSEDVFSAKEEEKTENLPVLETLTPVENVPEIAPVVNVSESLEEKPVLETLTPTLQQSIIETSDDSESISESDVMKAVEQSDAPIELTPVSETETEYKPTESGYDMTEIEKDYDSFEIENKPNSDEYKMSEQRPVPPVTSVKENVHEVIEAETKESKPSFVYYVLLFLLIVLSVFTLWLYQKNVKLSAPVLTAKVTEQNEDGEKFKLIKKRLKPEITTTKKQNENSEDVFVDDKTKGAEAYVVGYDGMPVVEGAVPAMVGMSGQNDVIENRMPTEEEILAKKPVYEPGAKHDEMFVQQSESVVVSEPGVAAEPEQVVVPNKEEISVDEAAPTVDVSENSEITDAEVSDGYYQDADMFYDEEEAAYQAEVAEQQRQLQQEMLEQQEMYYED